MWPCSTLLFSAPLGQGKLSQGEPSCPHPVPSNSWEGWQSAFSIRTPLRKKERPRERTLPRKNKKQTNKTCHEIHAPEKHHFLLFVLPDFQVKVQSSEPSMQAPSYLMLLHTYPRKKPLSSQQAYPPALETMFIFHMTLSFKLFSLFGRACIHFSLAKSCLRVLIPAQVPLPPRHFYCRFSTWIIGPFSVFFMHWILSDCWL